MKPVTPKTKCFSASNPELSRTPKPTGRFLCPRLLGCILGLVLLVISMATAQAVNLFWDPITAGAASDGSGTWHVNQWWNGATDQAWADGNAIIIGTNNPGVYSIVLDGAVSGTTLMFKTNGYTLSGSNLTLSAGLTLSSGVNAAINCLLSMPGTGITVGNNGSSLTLGGGYTSTTGNPIWAGSSPAASTIIITNGTFTEPGTFAMNNITVSQTGGVVNFNSFSIARTGSATYNLSGGQMNATAPGNSLLVSRNTAVSSAAIVNVSGTGLVGCKGSILIASTIDTAGATCTGNGTLNVSGGTVISGPGATGTPGVSATNLTTISLLAVTQTAPYAAAAKGILNISGGTVAAKGIVFGSSFGSYANNPVCQLNVSGGLIYLDSTGITLGSSVTGFNSPVLNISGGTIAATTNWIGSMPLKLNDTNGPVTFQAADVNNSPFNITLSGALTGIGGLIKTGGGTLTLGGTNTYTGSTTVSNGLLTFTTATLANRNYTVAAGELEAILDPTGVKLQMTMSNLTFGTGTHLGFDLASGSFGNTTSSLIAADTLTMNGNVAVDVSNAPGGTSDNVLFSYTSRTGAGVFVAGNIPAGAFIYDNTASRTVSLTYTQPPPPAPTFTSIGSVQTGGVLSGITFAGVHGPAGGSYQILSSTNVALQPLSAWTPVQNGNFDGSGSFNVTIGVNPAAPQTFYLLSVSP